MSIRLWCIVASLFFCSVSIAQDFYVSPNGSDILDGSSATINAKTKTGPFKTLAKAKQTIRDLKAAGKFTEAVTVHVGAGTYQLSSALEFNSADSGEPGKAITWDGVKGATLVTGAIQLKGCQTYDASLPDQILSCPLPASTVAGITQESNDRIKSTNAPKFEVFVDEQRLTLARWPDYDWAHVKAALNNNTKFKVFQQMPALSGNLENARVHIFANNDFYDELIDISQIDLTNNQLTLSSSTRYPINIGRRFFIENIASELNADSEWFYDRPNEKLLFIPAYGSTAKRIYISNSQNLFKLTNANNLKFSNLTLRHSTSSAITISNSDQLSFDNLEINNVGGTGIIASAGTNISVTNNVIHDTGLGGVHLTGGDRATLTPSKNVISNNYIYTFETTLFDVSPAIEVNGVGANVAHNTITNGAGTAIILRGNDHIIERNDISSICESSGDCGAIYSASDWTYRGNTIRYNYIHDSYGYTLNLETLNIDKGIIQYNYDGARGVYLDNGVSGFNVIGNLVVNSGANGIQIGGGRDNNIENNIIKTNRFSIVIDSRSPYFDWNVNRNSLSTMPINSPLWKAKYPELSKPMAHDTWPEGNRVVRNVTISTAYLGYSLKLYMPSTGNTVDSNLVWHTSSDIRVTYRIIDTGEVKGGALWEDWVSKGIETHSLRADPCLSIVGRKISLTCSNSPTVSLGIKGIPSDFGVIK